MVVGKDAAGTTRSTRYGFQQLEGQAGIGQPGRPRSVFVFAQKKMSGQPSGLLPLPFFNPNQPLAGCRRCGSSHHGFLTEAGKTGSKAGEEEHFYHGGDHGGLFFRMDRRQIGDWWRDWLTNFVHLLNQSATDA